jgi:DtxR family Mn-dependent transcriptional regulator
MYLKSIYQLGKDETLVAISALAAHLGISPVSATEMIHRMVSRKLVRHIPYKGVRLTEHGRKQALAVIRRHRLWERFLTDRLGFPWEHVHDVACRLEHAAGPEVTEALAAELGNPSTCPHGNPIPTADGEMPALEGISLLELDPGKSARIEVIQPEDSEVLEHLSSRGITPGVELRVVDIAPLDGPRTLSISGQQVVIGKEMASCIMVQPIAI